MCAGPAGLYSTRSIATLVKFVTLARPARRSESSKVLLRLAANRDTDSAATGLR